MSAVERVEYMDNQKSMILNETIGKEKKIQQQYFKDLEEQGKLKPVPPEPARPPRTMLATVGVPEYVQTARMDPEQSLATTISKNMWTSNPGYIIRDGQKLVSTMKGDYVWDEEELQLMKEQGHFDKTHNRKRDEFSNYVEASARFTMLMKTGNPAATGR